MIKEDGTFYSAQEFNTKYNIRTDYLTYLGILHAIPRTWKHKIQNRHLPSNTASSIMTKFQELNNTKKTCRFVYNKLIQKIIETPDRIIQQWKVNLHGNITDEDIYEAFSHLYTITSSTKYQTFQFRLLHRILVTNEDLYQWKLKQTDICTFCEEEIETISHLLLECEVTKLFWNNIEEWLYRICDIRIHIPPKDIILGKINIENNLFDLVYLVGKQYLYGCRCTETFPTLTGYVRTLKQLHDVEEHIAFKE